MANDRLDTQTWVDAEIGTPPAKTSLWGRRSVTYHNAPTTCSRFFRYQFLLRSPSLSRSRHFYEESLQCPGDSFDRVSAIELLVVVVYYPVAQRVPSNTSRLFRIETDESRLRKMRKKQLSLRTAMSTSRKTIPCERKRDMTS